LLRTAVNRYGAGAATPGDGGEGASDIDAAQPADGFGVATSLTRIRGGDWMRNGLLTSAAATGLCNVLGLGEPFVSAGSGGSG
jgi:hypothetical protein